MNQFRNALAILLACVFLGVACSSAPEQEAPPASQPAEHYVGPDECYTQGEDLPPEIPRDVNWYAWYLLGKQGAGAGAAQNCS